MLLNYLLTNKNLEVFSIIRKESAQWIKIQWRYTIFFLVGDFWDTLYIYRVSGKSLKLEKFEYLRQSSTKRAEFFF
jgi:hypothetical protein